MKVSDAAEGPTLGDLLRRIEAGELSVDEAAELLDTMITDMDAGAGDQHTQLDALLDQIPASAMVLAQNTAEASGIGRFAEIAREASGIGRFAEIAREASGIGRFAEMAEEASLPMVFLIAGAGEVIELWWGEVAQLGRRGRRKAADFLEAVAGRIEARRPGSALPWWLRCIAGVARRNWSTWPPIRQARAGSQRRLDYLTAQAPPGRCVSISPRKVRGPNPRTDIQVHPRAAAA